MFESHKEDPTTLTLSVLDDVTNGVLTSSESPVIELVICLRKSFLKRVDLVQEKSAEHIRSLSSKLEEDNNLSDDKKNKLIKEIKASENQALKKQTVLMSRLAEDTNFVYENEGNFRDLAIEDPQAYSKALEALFTTYNNTHFLSDSGLNLGRIGLSFLADPEALRKLILLQEHNFDPCVFWIDEPFIEGGANTYKVFSTTIPAELSHLGTADGLSHLTEDDFFLRHNFATLENTDSVLLYTRSGESLIGIPHGRTVKEDAAGRKIGEAYSFDFETVTD